jgi:PAS domain S-box-containing protein
MKELIPEEKLRKTIIDSIPGAFYILDEHGRYVHWNAYQRDVIIGKREDQIAGTRALDTIHPDDREHIQIKIAHVLETGDGETIEVRVLLCGGPSFKWFLMTGRRIEIEGKPYLVGVAIDINERKKFEYSLHESNVLMSAIVENIPLMVFLKEAKNLKFALINRAGEDLLGYLRKDLLGKSDMDFFPPAQAAHFITKDREVINGTMGVLDIPVESIQTVNKGERLLHTQKVCIRGDGGKARYLLGISEDITNQKKVQDELRTSRDVLQGKVDELELFNKVTVDRELKMIELKNRLEEIQNATKNER